MDSRARLLCYPRGSFYQLSPVPPMKDRGITKTYFRTCSTLRCCSQASLSLCSLITVSIRNKLTFVPLRYSLAGYRPSKTAHLALFPSPSSGELSKPNNLQREVLHCCRKTPSYTRQSKIVKAMPNYSKAPRGLFVQVGLGRVFTANAISPSETSRQLLTRDAIRAGQNLPGKELRSKSSFQ